MVAAPQPPSLKLPQPVADLAAKRTGNEVALRWTMPKRTTDNVLLSGKQTAIVCRRVGSGPCAMLNAGKFAPEASASFLDHLPAALIAGTPRRLSYTVELKNQSGRSAGPSNAAITAAGAAPPPVDNLRARAQADGIVLSWVPSGIEETIRIRRILIPEKNAPKAKIPAEQTLEFTGPDQGRVLDHDAVLDHTYSYTVQRIAKTTIQGHHVEVAGLPGKPAIINARDLFPPDTPTGLQAVADAEAHAIDLSWQPDTEADLAGYQVYRRDVGSSTPPVRVSGAMDSAPSYRDTTAQLGHTYWYSVSAVDKDGNESSRSPEVEETLPQQ